MGARISSREIGRTDRLEARIPARLKVMLQRAAALQGQSLTDFVLSSTTEAARRIIRQNDLLDLSRRDQVALARALLEPPAATRALARAARRFGRGGKG